jgi:hypothetical protein
MGTVQVKKNRVVVLGKVVAATLHERSICKDEHIEIIGKPVTVQFPVSSFQFPFLKVRWYEGNPGASAMSLG